ncbi:amino acid/amide ABC transporter substrate-binding protein, HAAT family [Halohasta litchfieldiae]|jgi:branched-chain amino acid transport system substrate-binding protein|uniref:Amino acid/amide ABC transporter substrate-binding protein, HAAT family n=2 Tax=Halohasta litchfieldiae TaxID=1073996 RepID=A0A1H6VQ20_9EURY|nr:amino acid/amide ABC transporter substrate-binding protein, HAAT family [Halohasta litchfieldiae]
MDMKSNSVNRRTFVKTAGAAGITVSIAGCSGGGSDDSDTIKIGILEDQSGNFSINGLPKYRSSVLAIEEINEAGGILGREVEYVAPDPQSNVQRYRELAEQLILQDDVDMLTGAFASNTREAIRPTVNEEEQLYFYSNEYEGGLCDNTTFAIGSIPEQQYGTLIPYMIDEFGPEAYIIAADYNFGQLSADWIRAYVEENGGEVVGEEFPPLSVSQYGSSINRIQDADPDFLATVLVGSNQSAFFTQAENLGLDVPMASSVNLSQSYEHVRFDPPTMEGMHSAVYYMEEIPTDRNQDFVDRFYDRWPDNEYIAQMAMSPYVTLQLYKQAVEEAGTVDQQEVISVLEEGMDVEAPSGDLSLKGSTHHMSHNMRLARVEEDHSISFIESDIVEPSFLEEAIGCDLTEQSDTTQYSLEDADDFRSYIGNNSF